MSDLANPYSAPKSDGLALPEAAGQDTSALWPASARQRLANCVIDIVAYYFVAFAVGLISALAGATGWIADAGINFALTGQKSYHHFVPSFGLGVGVSKSNSSQDIGTYRFGTGFALHYGVGLRFVTHGPWGARVDLTEYLWQLSYPSSYFLTPTGGTAVLQASQSQNEWKQNPTITFGISYIFSR